MHRYEVGKPYRPGVTNWPPCSQFDWRDAELELTLFLDSPSQDEIEAIRVGVSEFLHYDNHNLVVLCCGFRRETTMVHSSHAAFQCHLLSEADRVAISKSKPELCRELTVVLVQATGGLIEVGSSCFPIYRLHDSSIPSDPAQADACWDPAAYDQELKDLHSRYPSEIALSMSSRSIASAKPDDPVWDAAGWLAGTCHHNYGSEWTDHERTGQ